MLQMQWIPAFAGMTEGAGVMLMLVCDGIAVIQGWFRSLFHV